MPYNTKSVIPIAEVAASFTIPHRELKCLRPLPTDSDSSAPIQSHGLTAEFPFIHR